MELQDITQDRSKLGSYYDVYVQQPGEIVAAYRNRNARFPIFSERVFVPPGASANAPHRLLASRYRTNLAQDRIGKLILLERLDNPREPRYARLFLVWASPAMLERFKAEPPERCTCNVHVLFHPFGNLADYPAYWRGGIDPLKVPNYVELGVRYLFKEKQGVLQHLCAVRPNRGVGQIERLDDPKSALDILLVVPVASPAAFFDLTDPAELELALISILRRTYEAAASTPRVAPVPPTLGRVAVSGFSRSGEILLRLLKEPRNSPFMERNLKEVYALDVVLNETDKSKPARTKREGYDLFWARLKAWQGDDADRRIRLYSAEPESVQGVYQELRNRLARYGGGYHNSRVPFASFNGQKGAQGDRVFANLVDGYEIYSTDGSRSLVMLPSANTRVYLSSEHIENDRGFQPDLDFEPELEGHSWFVSRLISHAIYQSGFW